MRENDSSHAPGEVRRVAVLGAGTMGAQIAAHLADRGIPCDLLDLASEGDEPSRIAEQAKVRLTTLRPAPIENVDTLKLIRTGNFAADLARLSEADWVIEAIVERLGPKRELWAKAASHVRPDAIVSTNTSGIPIVEIAQALPPELRRRFLGTHFFNPPRYLRLLEVIPTADCEPSVVEGIRRFAEEVLDKGVVVAHDVPGFITNRIGSYYFLVVLRAAEELDLAPDEVDSITGPPMGRPNSATYRTIDLVGLDILVDICDNARAALTETWEQEAFEVPQDLRDMLNRGWLGDKSGQGFYQRVRQDGESRILALHLEDMEYRPRQRTQSPLLASLGDIEDVGRRIRTLAEFDEVEGRFAWRVLSQLLAYSARKVGEVADDIVSIDRAMRWGFNWSLGPFETWDALGVAETVQRMRNDGIEVSAWVSDLADRGESFYQNDGDATLQATPESRYVPVPR